ncbi:transmembrane protein 50A-like [Hetaerina americana]|uniref:transmembrane protein 50A-like n=1 Tax=Hetaerina americana TaxID=62018 RepID=UPI003A7F4E1E
MAGCFENVHIPACKWFEGGDKRNAVASMVAGVMFFMGWWFIIDVASTYPDMAAFNHAYHICGVVGTISLFIDGARKTFISPHGKKAHWPGVGLFLQNTFIFIGSLVYKFGRSEDLWG